ncbi:MAG: hypothetical protein LAT66_00760 [Alkalimonas sp.]|nr:hypothetical protein [Alkalimonas sp.]
MKFKISYASIKIEPISLVLCLIIVSIMFLIVYFAYAPKRYIGIEDDIYYLRANTWKSAKQAMIDNRDNYFKNTIVDLNGSLDDRVSEIFELPRANVDNAADWYYSSWSRITRIGRVIIRSDVESFVLEGINERLFPEKEWEAVTNQLNIEIREKSLDRNQEAMESAISELLGRLDPFKVSETTISPLVSINSIQGYEGQYEAAITDHTLMYQAGFSVAASTVVATATRAVIQRAAARAATRTATASITPAAAACGPGAWLCAAGIWTVSLGATEYGILKFDEYRNRPELERILMEDINRMEAAAKGMANEILYSAFEDEYEFYSGALLDQLRPIDIVFDRNLVDL